MIIKDLIGKIRKHRLFLEVKNYNNILVIGGGGRNDWKYLQDKGLKVTLLDIREVKGANRFIKQSITEKTPFLNNEFDCIVLSTVLEYVIDDIKALKEINRILDEKGKLVLDVEYLNSIPEFPHRLYNYATIKYILEYTQFEILSSEHRGFFQFLYYKKFLKIFLIPLMLLVKKDFNKWIKIENYISNKMKILDTIIKYNSGDFIIAKKINKKFKWYKE